MFRFSEIKHCKILSIGFYILPTGRRRQNMLFFKRSILADRVHILYFLDFFTGRGLSYFVDLIITFVWKLLFTFKNSYLLISVILLSHICQLGSFLLCFPFKTISILFKDKIYYLQMFN